MNERDPLQALTSLTRRELQVFDLAAECTSNDGIAATLGITVKTVQSHRARINKKLGLHSPAQLVLFAHRASRARPGTPP